MTVEKVIDIDGTYGTTHLHILVDDAGNVAKWFASSERLDAGKTYSIKATVQAHDVYQGSKQTVLTRGKVTE